MMLAMMLKMMLIMILMMIVFIIIGGQRAGAAQRPGPPAARLRVDGDALHVYHMTHCCLSQPRSRIMITLVFERATVLIKGPDGGLGGQGSAHAAVTGAGIHSARPCV